MRVIICKLFSFFVFRTRKKKFSLSKTEGKSITKILKNKLVLSVFCLWWYWKIIEKFWNELWLRFCNRGLFSKFYSIPPHIPKVTHTCTVLINSSNKEISSLGENTPKINFPRKSILAIHIDLTLQNVNVKIVVTDEGKFAFMVSLQSRSTLKFSAI